MLDTKILHAFSMFESNHVDDARERIAEHFGAHQLYTGGRQMPFYASMAKVTFGGVSFASIRSTQLRSVKDAMSRSYSVMLCPSGQATVRSRSLDAENGIFLSPNDTFEAELSDECEQLFVLFDESLLRKVGGGALLFEDAIDLRKCQLRPWVDQVQSLLNSRQLIEVLQNSNSCAQMMGQLLLELLLMGHHPVEAPPTSSKTIAPLFIKNAEAYIEAHANEIVQLEDIARAANVAERTLHVGFRKFRGYSPMQFLSQIRLMRAHSVLSNGTTGTKITAIAIDCGFTHLGRFSKAYQAHFGERPSQTLLRATGVNSLAGDAPANEHGGAKKAREFQ